MLKSGYGLRDLIEQLFADSGLRPRISFEADDAHTARGLVSAGLGVTVVPSYVPDAETVQLRIDHPEARRTIGAVARRGVLVPSVGAFLDFLRGLRTGHLGRGARPVRASRSRRRSALTADERVRPIDPAAGRPVERQQHPLPHRPLTRLRQWRPEAGADQLDPPRRPAA